MRLTIDCRLIRSSGIGVYLQNIIKSDLLRQYNLTLLYKEADKRYFNDLISCPKLIPYNAALYSIKELLNTSIKTRNTDIFWSPHYNVPLFNFASKLKVVTIHDVFHLAYYQTLSTVQKIYARWMINKAVKSDLILTVSEFSKAEILKYTNCNPNKIKVVYNGIDFKKFNSKNTDTFESIFKKYKITSPYILFVGNVKPHKNLKTALLGFKKFICSTNLRYKFIIAGKREGFITVDKEISEVLNDSFYSDKVQFTGWVEDDHLPVLYQQAAACIFPSVYEGFGFPPLEAMAAGCVVVSSNAACMTEIYGDSALYFNPEKTEEIAQKLNDVLTNSELRNCLINKGFSQAKKYNWNDTVSKSLQLLQEYALD